MAAARAKKEKTPPGPDDLVRESAGVYVTGDGRFRVEKSDVGWYLVDSAQTNEFGQQLIHGPMPTLDAIREAIPGARDLKPLLRVRPATSRTAKKTPPPPPKSWIDELPDKEATRVRRLVRALQAEGLEDAEELVRLHRDDMAPTIATKVIEHRLRSLVDEQPDPERNSAQLLIRRAVEILTSDGAAMQGPAPRWALVEVGQDHERPRNKIRPQV
jgi:hypothetical protein